MSLDHIIKLFINLFVFLLSAWGESERGVELWAFTTFVFLLAQRLSGSPRTISEKKNETERRGRGVRRGSGILTHSLCLLIIRSMSSLIFLYLSSDSGLWPSESSASGSGLSQPFKPFFLKVCGQSHRTQLRRMPYGRDTSQTLSFKMCSEKPAEKSTGLRALYQPGNSPTEILRIAIKHLMVICV